MTSTNQRRGRWSRGLALLTGAVLSLGLLLASPSSGPAQAGDAADQNLALTATADADYTAPWNSLGGINDGVQLTDALNKMWGNYSGDRPAESWVSYHFDQPVTVDHTEMFFWTDAGSAGTGDHVWLPASWKLQYKSATVTDWTDVPDASGYPAADQAAAETTFPALTLTDLRAVMEADSNADQSSYSALSITEWEVWGVPAPTQPTSPTDPLLADEIDIPTTVGTVPTLPAQAWMTYVDGRRAELPVTWPSIAADKVASPGTFSLTGTASGVTTPVTATIYVRAQGTTPKLVDFYPQSALTIVGKAPDLPATALAVYDDGSVDSSVPVTWDDPGADAWSTSGIVTVEGTVAGTALRPSIAVIVDDPAPADAAPIVSIDSPSAPSSGWFTTAVPITVSASSDTDPSPAIEYRVDDGDWQAYTGEVSITADGKHTFSARATDADGNVSAVRSVDIDVDGTAPTTTAQTTIGADAVTLQLDSTDAGSGVASVQYQVGDGFIASYAGSPVSITRQSAAQTVRYFATDAAGNVETAKTFDVPAKADDGNQPGGSQAATTTVLTIPSGSVVIGGKVTGRVVVTGAGTTPTGTVVVSAGPVELGRGSLAADGSASIVLSTAGLRPGNVAVTAAYSGDTANLPSSATGAITVAKAPSTLKAKLKKVRVRRGKHDSVKVTVSAPGLVPTGTVTIKSGGKVVGRGVLAGGRVRIALRTKLTVGRHKLTARFAGDPWVQGSKDAVHLVISRGARR